MKTYDRVTITLESSLNERLVKVSKKLGWRKSQIIADLLKEALPYMEQVTPENVIALGIKRVAGALDELSNIVEEGDKK